MKNEYKKIGNKIVCYDDILGLEEYEYQDNINEVLKQKNIIETIDNNIKKLNIEKENILELKEDFTSTLLNKKNQISSIVILTIALLYTPLALINNLLFIPIILFLISMIPIMAIGQKNYKKHLDSLIQNINDEIKELNERNILEKETLKSLCENKTSKYINTVNPESIFINNSINPTIKEIQRKKIIYQYFRHNCEYIKFWKDNKKLYSLLNKLNFTEDEIHFIENLSEKYNKTLTKK